MLQIKYITGLLLLNILLLLSSCGGKNDQGYRVMKGPFVQSVIETGELAAVNASAINMPRINYVYGYNFKIVWIAGHGSTVKKGDPVIKVDPASVEKYIIERNQSLETEKAAANKLKAEQTNSLQDLKAQLRNEQSSFDIKKLAVERSGFESEAIKKVMQLEYRQEEIRLERLKKKLEVKPKLDSLDYRIQQIKINQKRDELDDARKTLGKMTVYSPLDGIFVVEKNWNTGQYIKAGDNVYIDQMIGMIPDINRMKVKGYVQENDISKIRQGLDVVIRLDALPSVAFHGKIGNLGMICVEQDDKRVFPAEVFINESDPRLKPGMTVSCEYLTWVSSDVLYVPNNCLLDENRHFYVFVKKGRSVRKTEVRPGPTNNSFTVVSGDIKDGQLLELPENIEKGK